MKELSAGIVSSRFAVTWSPPLLEEKWISISPEQVDDMLRCFTRLQDPGKTLDLSCEALTPVEYALLLSKNSQFFKSFTSVELWAYYEQFNKQLLEDMIAGGRLESIFIASTVLSNQPMAFLVDYFFSESCRSLSVDFEDFGVVLGVINRWKEMDPRGLAPGKIFKGINASPDDLSQVGMTTIPVDSAEVGMTAVPVDSAEVEILRMIENKVTYCEDIGSLHRIDHTVDPRRTIYVVFYGYGACALMFE
uniref:BACK domain-containing protein n=1 Tax=Steinernema glaseri TaxID=37863 RepID=A0A1I8A370_9BILA